MGFRSAVLAVAHLKRLHGGSQPHLLYGADRRFYVVKFTNNPQGRRILVNELLVSRLAQRIGLPVPRAVVIEVCHDLIARSPNLTIETIGGSIPCAAGIHFGTELINGSDAVSDFLPDHELQKAARVCHFFAGALALDKWTGNTDFRQAIFVEHRGRNSLEVKFIDNGMCFDGDEWSFRDKPAHGVYQSSAVYRADRCRQDCTPWLRKIEALTREDILRCGQDVPAAWVEGEEESFHGLMSDLARRRASVRKLVANSISGWIKRSPSPQQGIRSSLREALKVA